MLLKENLCIWFVKKKNYIKLLIFYKKKKKKTNHKNTKKPPENTDSKQDYRDFCVLKLKQLLTKSQHPFYDVKKKYQIRYTCDTILRNQSFYFIYQKCHVHNNNYFSLFSSSDRWFMNRITSILMPIIAATLREAEKIHCFL